jgi:hypothetical protein
MAKDKNWIQKALPPSSKGKLHKALGVPEGKKIPASKLAIKPGDSALMKKRKNLAKTLTFMSSK